MPEDLLGAKEGDSPTLEGAVAESPAVKQEVQEQQETQTPTAEQGETQVEQEQEIVPLHKEERFKELIEERNWYRQQLERQSQQRPQVQQPTQDQYAGMTAEEEKFWRAVDERAERKAKQLFESSVSPQLQLGAAELARIKVAEFRRNHPDVKPESVEEREIARRINSGYELDDAYWAVMGPKGIRNAETQATKKVQQQMSVKKQANVENRGIPSTAPSLPSRKLSLNEQIRSNYDKMERGEL